MRKASLFVIVIWILLVGISLMWGLQNLRKEHVRETFQKTRDYATLLIVTREWNALHGGVYAPVSTHAEPNPYLDDPLRDIKINEELTLTKINPAYMTRQISEILEKEQGIRFHITSLKPVRPANKPSEWEKKALRTFEKGEKEVGEFIKDGDQTYFYYMAPLYTQESCLKCHEKQGYKLGDIRGGIRISLPDVQQIELFPIILSYALLFSLGIFIIMFFSRKLSYAYQTIQLQAATDALTEIPNRRYFLDYLMYELKNCQREQKHLSLIMCDIDYFKNYNDVYGHEAGDECLKRLAHTISVAAMRPGDFCARFGGEEFVVILPNTDLPGALYVAERIRTTVEILKIPHSGSEIHEYVTISLGVASRHCSTETSYEELINEADQALYRAKANGRNRVE